MNERSIEAAGKLHAWLGRAVETGASDLHIKAGDVFDKPTAERLLRYIYSAGGSRAPEAAYTAFRGRLPTEEALLRRRGLLDAATA